MVECFVGPALALKFSTYLPTFKIWNVLHLKKNQWFSLALGVLLFLKMLVFY